MHSASFAERTAIDDEADLRRAFGSELLFLGPGAVVTFDGVAHLGHNVSFAGRCSLGDGCRIDDGAILEEVVLGPRNHVRPHSILNRVTAEADNLFGPFCFVRDDCAVASQCILGAHVEAARSQFSSGVKVSHRAFIGDAEIGPGTIIGAGVVFCNYADGRRNSTAIAGGVVVGSGTMLVPPLAIGEGSTIGAGSVVTKNVPAGAKVIQKRSEWGK